MNLLLGVTLSCDETGCQVKLVASGEVLTVNYSGLVQDRIRIQPHQLVAVRRGPTQTEIVWRWIRGRVQEVNDETIGFVDPLGKLGFAVRVPDLPLNLTDGDEIWFCSTDRDLEVHDSIVSGGPAHPQRVLDYIAPIIERVYATTDF